MNSSQHHFQFHIGQRNLKTALAATLCAIGYFLIDRNPTFACIGAIFGVGSDTPTGKIFLHQRTAFFENPVCVF